MTTLTLVVVHREQPERCVETVRRFVAQADAPAGLTVRPLVVDNGSSEEAVARVSDGLPGVEILRLPGNAGFGPAANAGIRHWLASSAEPWVALVPHDVHPAPGCLRRLVEAVSARPRAGLASCEFGEDLVPVVDPYFGGIEVPAVRGDGWHDAGYPHGSLMLLARACLEDVGLFDERYFAYCEEADLAVRARRAGWEVGIVWGARVTNTHLSTPLEVIEYLKLRNSLLLVRRHFGRYRTFIRGCFAAVTTARQALVRAQRPPGFSPRARVLAVRDFARGRFGPPPSGAFPDWQYPAAAWDPQADGRTTARSPHCDQS